jgi:hypothetical protein
VKQIHKSLGARRRSFSTDASGGKHYLVLTDSARHVLEAAAVPCSDIAQLLPYEFYLDL